MQKNATSPELLASDSEGLPGERNAGDVVGIRFSWQRFWLIIASAWLHLMVILFIAIQIKSRVKTPMTDWVHKAVRLLGLE